MNPTEWMKRRTQLFFDYCVPSIEAQKDQAFVWHIFLDADTPDEQRELLEIWALEYPNANLVYSDCGSPGVKAEEARLIRESPCDVYTSTRIDNDDAFDPEVIQKVRSMAKSGKKGWVVFPDGSCFCPETGEVTSLYYIKNNAPTLIETWEGAKGCMSVRHDRVKENHKMSFGRPLWCHVVHEDNLANRMRGNPASRAFIKRIIPETI